MNLNIENKMLKNQRKIKVENYLDYRKIAYRQKNCK